jgi:oxygen-independent coproporphyrinogen-3 oxidase
MTRYLTYPSIDWFVEAFGSIEIGDWLTAAGTLDPVHPPTLSVTVPQGAEPGLDGQVWLDAFARETDLYAARIPHGRILGEMAWHIGRESLPPSWLGSLFDVLASGFYMGSRPRLIASVDPRADLELLLCLAAKGFTRIDVGDQGDDAVGAALSESDAAAAAAWQESVLEHATRLSEVPEISLGVGIRYGVPGQTLETAQRTLDRILGLSPARIHCKPARRASGIAASVSEHGMKGRARGAHLPMLQLVLDRLDEAGYRRVGVGTYALRGDVLENAQRHGHLMMRPYGPSAAAGLTTVALGPGAIGCVGPVYYQNQRSGTDYITVLEQGALPVARGVSLGQDDLIRRAVIHSLSCNLFVDIEALNLAYGIDFEQHFAAEMSALTQLEQAELITRSVDAIEVTGTGKLLVDSVCSVFDSYLRRHRSSKPYTTLL